MNETTRYDQMAKAARIFNARYPIVWELFVKFTFEKIDQGFKHYSVTSIMERIRWETDQAPTGDECFKINNNHRAFYARAFMARYPEHKGFFRLRRQTSKDCDAVDLPELTPKDFEDEEDS